MGVVAVLGTDHSPQLAGRGYEPALLRAYLARVLPTAICIEAPAEGAIPDFVYEAQHVAVPFAQAEGIPVYPIDWIPSSEDQMLAWGVPDLLAPPLIRKQFRTFSEVPQGLFFAEEASCRAKIEAWQDSPRAAGERDFPRRLSLYRTFMQAMKVKRAAANHPDGLTLVIVGYMHKYDIEEVLGGGLVQPSNLGAPTPAEVVAARTPQDDWAVLSFNLLGQQVPLDRAWIEEVLQRAPSGAEAELFRARFAGAGPDVYRAIAARQDADRPFTFDGVVDRSRLDSYYDPFGNLSIRQRALLAADGPEAIRPELSGLQASQLAAYWPAYGRGSPDHPPAG